MLNYDTNSDRISKIWNSVFFTNPIGSLYGRQEIVQCVSSDVVGSLGDGTTCPGLVSLHQVNVARTACVSVPKPSVYLACVNNIYIYLIILYK